MPAVLLKPYLLGCKNRLLGKSNPKRKLSSELFMVAATLGTGFVLYWGTVFFLFALENSAPIAQNMPARMFGLFFLGFLALLCFSNFVAALGSFYSAKDIPLLLAAPVSPFRFFIARLIEMICHASWMFFLFGIPSAFAYYNVFGLAPQFLLMCAVVAVLFLFIPAAISTMLATFVVNMFSVSRIGEMLALFGFGAVCVMLVLSQHLTGGMNTDRESLNYLTAAVSAIEHPGPAWLPSRFAGDVLGGYLLSPPRFDRAAFSLLVMSCFIAVGVSYLVFRLLFRRGYMLANESNHTVRIEETVLTGFVGWLVRPINSQIRALASKEAKMFIRDTAQSLQLILILFLTFLYLYNFRALREAGAMNPESRYWWEAVLCIANIAMGGCVSAAIATRFVFPAVSLEGRAYWLIRATPLGIPRYLRAKAGTWYIPITLVTFVLLVSGALASQAPVPAVFVTGALSAAISIGVVGLAIGIGAYYVRLDWESPSQVVSSFGSLVYMVLSFVLVVLSLLPASYLFFVTCVPLFLSEEQEMKSMVSMFCAFFLIFFINLAAARMAIRAGEQALWDLEK